MLWDPKKKHMTSFDGRETAPASATPTMFLDAGGKPLGKMQAIPGGLSVGVPGVVAMLDLAHRKYGKLPWAVLFQPAIDLAAKGFPRRQEARGDAAAISAGWRRCPTSSATSTKPTARLMPKARS